MNKQIGTHGFSVGIAAVIIAVLVIGAGVWYATQDDMQGDAMMENDNGAMEQNDAMMEGDTSMEGMLDDDAMMESDSTMEGDAMMGNDVSFSGQVLAGSGDAPFLVFNQADYNVALASQRTVVLYFYANWCPICRAEIPKAEAAFDAYDGADIVGFRVNYNDNETSAAEEALAREFGVAYQHTKVFVRRGAQILKSPETWETERYLEEFAAAVN